MITTSHALEELLGFLANTKRIALDTEADSLHCYHEKLCLIQISNPDQDFLVDPLAGFSLTPLFNELAKKELVLHGADFDLRLLWRAGLIELHTLFDTMLAARLVGSRDFSLAALILHYFEITLPKGSQKANWAQRPLSLVMTEYAKNDTHYLLPLAQKLEEELHQLGRYSWFQQSCERAIFLSRINRSRDLENAWRISGSHALHGRSAAVLRALWKWREEEACSIDRPPFHIMRNEELIESAIAFDKGTDILLRHLTGSRKNRFFKAAEAALNLLEEDWPKPIYKDKPRTRLTPKEEKLFCKYKARRDKAAVDLGLDPSLIAPKSVLEALAVKPEEVFANLLPWQQEIIGEVSSTI